MRFDNEKIFNYVRSPRSNFTFLKLTAEMKQEGIKAKEVMEEVKEIETKIYLHLFVI